MAHLYAGTSGFAYDAWKPDFYPKEVKSKQYLAHYATRLNAVEINYTFRRLVSSSTLENWVQATPENFVFVIKAHQRLTHIQRLKPGEFNELFFKSIDPLRVVKRLGPVLFQLPPNLKADTALIADFLATVPKDLRCAIEFRHPSWLADPVYALLEQHGAALCLAETDDFTIPEVVTGGFVYCRLRKSDYTPEDRALIQERVDRLLADNRDVYVFFKHEETPAGALYAEALLRR
jgi:uncharacterized protein YecE (DUF72 family)